MNWRTYSIAVLLVAATAALLVLGMYGAGYLYFLLNRAVPQHIELTTWYLYWQAYGGEPAQRPRLLIAAVLPLLLPAAMLLALLQPRPRALYGDARWASTREIRDAGLL